MPLSNLDVTANMESLSVNTSAETVRRARAILQHHAKTFRAASLFLSPKQRDDAAIAYAFCRLVDDAVDEATDPITAERQLTELEASLYSGSGDPIVVAYRELAERAGFGLQPAEDLIRGAQSDLGQVLLQNDQELLTYCYRVAGTVGLMMCGILGVQSPEARRHAIDLGVAMQLTNICRDVLEDAQRGRVYLPADSLDRAGLSQKELLVEVRLMVGKEQGTLAPPRGESGAGHAVALVVDRLLSLADIKYASGAAGFGFLPTRARLAIQVASRLYQNIGVKLRRDRACNSLQGRVTLSSSRKRWLTLQAIGSWVLGLLPKRAASRSVSSSTSTASTTPLA
jgi:15-cis-phytoene synthase